MTELLTAAQMRAIEEAAIESGEVTGLELMERAGQGVVEAIFEEWPELAKTSHRAVVLCGPGNNGGDGFVVARLLKDWGWEVEVFLYGDPAKLPPDAKVNYERWRELGAVKPLPEGFWLPDCDLHVDALFGTGLTRAISDNISYSLSYLSKSHPHFRAVAVDAPSGLCMDSGRALGVSGQANLTVSFHTAKVGHYVGDGPARSGRLIVKDIGIREPSLWKMAKTRDEGLRDVNIGDPEFLPALQEQGERSKEVLALLSGKVTLVTRPSDGKECMQRQSGLLAKMQFQLGATRHKYSHGHALILSGGAGKTGAARLAARGALRIGAGLVTLGAPPSALMEVASQVTALMIRRVEDSDGLAAVLEDQRLNALCLGPGLGKGERERALILAALEAKRPMVLDADALSILFFDEADALFGKLHDQCVLTPHGGEFVRMFPDIAEKLNAPATKGPAYSKVDATRAAAKRAGCVILFKGPDTVIAAPDGRCSINSAQYERAAPWLATAGSGDVLAGFITGLLARGFAPMHAAETAAWLHVECARSFGPGLIAEDLPEELPKVFRALGL